MTKAQKAEIVAILENAKGDYLYRAESAFRGMDAKAMAEQYGQSGQTRQQIVDGYRRHEAKIDQLIQAVRALDTFTES